MTSEPDPTGPSLDEEGIPDLEGPLPEKAATGDPQEGVPVPSTRPAAFDWGTTVEEQRAGEPLSVRIGRERADLGEPGALDTGADAAFVLVDAADEGPGLSDREKDAVARRVPQPDLGIGPEERAMHIVETDEQVDAEGGEPPA